MHQSALLVVAHGSRNAEANGEASGLAATLAGLRLADTTTACFLELAEPRVGDEIDRLVAAGVRSLTVLPLFLAAGRHVREDLPRALSQAQARHPDLTIESLGYIGQSPHFVASIERFVRSAMTTAPGD